MEIFAAMEKMPLFHGLDREQIQELFRHSGAQRRTYTRGEMVLRARSSPPRCCGPGSGLAVWDCCSPEAYTSFGRISGVGGPLWAL